jgi:hypothetical protein
MFCVPLLRLLLIRGLEEDTTDAKDSALLAHGLFSFLVIITGTMPLWLEPCSAFFSSSDQGIRAAGRRVPKHPLVR